MLFRLFVLSSFIFAVVVAAEPPTTRPKNCSPGTTYKKDCNFCTCGTSPKTDSCTRINCDRQNSNLNTTKRPSSGVRPGSCPAIAAPPPGNTDCSRRKQTSQCKIDKDCNAAKKCCRNGCGIFLCRNAIYRYTS